MEVDERLRWLETRISSSLRPRGEDLRVLFADEENRSAFLNFCNNSEARHLFIHVPSNGGAGGLHVSSFPPKSIADKALFFLKCSHASKLSKESITEDVVYSECSELPLEHLELVVREVYLPLVAVPGSLPHGVAGDKLLDLLHRLINSLQVTSGFQTGQLVLPLPSLRVLAEAAMSGVSRRGVVVHILESCVVAWMKQVKMAMHFDPQAAILKNHGKQAGPMAEIEFWSSRLDRLLSVREQLGSLEVLNILHSLEQAHSTYSQAFIHVHRDIGKAIVDTELCLMYVNTLKSWSLQLHNAFAPDTLIKLFPPLLTIIALVWQHSGVYSLQRHFHRLLRLVANEVARKARDIVGEDPLEDPDGAVTNLRLALRVCASFRGCYLDQKELASSVGNQLKQQQQHGGTEPYASMLQPDTMTANSKAQAENNTANFIFPSSPSSLCRWPARNSPVFSALNATMERCNDILELVQTILHFSELSTVANQPNSESGDPVMCDIDTHFHQALCQFRSATQNLLNLEPGEFERSFFVFRSTVKDLERQLSLILLESFEQCSSLPAKMRLLESFQGLMSRENIQSVLQKQLDSIVDELLADITTVHQSLPSLLSQPPTLTNIPPVATTLLWVCASRERVDVPIERLRKAAPQLLEGDKGFTLRHSLAELKKDFEKQFGSIVGKWERHVPQGLEEKLKCNVLLIQDGSGLLSVNFDPSLERVLREAHYLSRPPISIALPPTVRSLQQSVDTITLHHHTATLHICAHHYNNLQQLLDPVYRSVFQHKLQLLDNLLSQGLNSIAWCSPDLADYLAQLRSLLLSDLLPSVDTLLTHTEAMTDIVSSWATHNWLDMFATALAAGKETNSEEKKDEEKGNGEALQNLKERHSKLMESIERMLSLSVKHIHRHIELAAKSVDVSRESPSWYSYLSYLDSVVEKGLKELLLQVMSTLSLRAHQYEQGSSIPPLVSVSLVLYSKEMQFLPPLSTHSTMESVPEVVRSLLEGTLAVMKTVNRLEPTKQKESYYTALQHNADIRSAIQKITAHVETSARQCQSLRKRFSMYAFLWEEDVLTMFDDFLRGVARPHPRKFTRPETVRSRSASHSATTRPQSHSTPPSNAIGPPSQTASSVMESVAGVTDWNFLRTGEEEEEETRTTAMGQERARSRLGEGRTISKRPTLEDFDGEIAVFQGILQRLEITREQTDVGWVCVDQRPARATLTSLVNKWTHVYASYLESRVVAVLGELEVFFNAVEPQVEAITGEESDTAQFERLVAVFNKVNQQQVEMDHKFGAVHRAVSILDKFNYPLSSHARQQFEAAPQRWTTLRKRVSLGKQRISPQLQKHSVLILKDLQLFGEKASSLYSSFLASSCLTHRCSQQEADTIIEGYVTQFRELQEQASDLRELQELLETSVFNFGLLNDFEEALTALKQLREYADVIHEEYSHWLAQCWVTVDTEAVLNTTQHHEALLATLHQCSEGWDLRVEVEGTIREAQLLLPVIDGMCSSSMRPRHWKQVLRYCPSSTLQTSVMRNGVVDIEQLQQLSVERLKEFQLHFYCEEVLGVVEKADREVAIEQLLRTTEEVWLSKQFQLRRHTRNTLQAQVTELSLEGVGNSSLSSSSVRRHTITSAHATVVSPTPQPLKTSNSVKLLFSTDELFEALNHYQTSLQGVMGTAAASSFADELQRWHKQLQTVEAVLLVWEEVQELWIQLEDFYGSSEVAQHLPTPHFIFTAVDKEWKELMAATDKNRSVLSTCLQEDLLSKLEKCRANLQQCQSALLSYMEGKRTRCSWFNFLSLEDILKFVCYGSNIASLSDNISKLLPHSQKLVFSSSPTAGLSSSRINSAGGSSTYIAGVVSRAGEKLDLCEAVCCQGLVEAMINDLIHKVSQSLQNQFSSLVTNYVLPSANQDTEAAHSFSFLYGLSSIWTGSNASQITILVTQVALDLAMQKAIGSAGEEQQLLESLQTVIGELIETACEALRGNQSWTSHTAIPKRVLTTLSEECASASNTTIEMTGDSSALQCRSSRALKPQTIQHLLNVLTVLLATSSKVKQLISTLSNTNSFTWQASLHFSLSQSSADQSQQHSCVLTTLTGSVPYGFCYTGSMSSGLMLSPVMEKGYVYLLQLMKQRHFSVESKQCQSAHSSSVIADLAVLSGHTLFTLPCSEVTSHYTLVNCVKGMVATGAWLCLPNLTSLAPPLIQRFANLLAEVHSAWKSNSSTVKFMKDSLTLAPDPFCMATVSSNEAYHALPSSFLSMFKSFSLPGNNLDYDIFIEASLLANGFKNTSQLLSTLLSACELNSASTGPQTISLKEVIAVVCQAGKYLKVFKQASLSKSTDPRSEDSDEVVEPPLSSLVQSYLSEQVVHHDDSYAMFTTSRTGRTSYSHEQVEGKIVEESENEPPTDHTMTEQRDSSEDLSTEELCLAFSLVEHICSPRSQGDSDSVTGLLNRLSKAFTHVDVGNIVTRWSGVRQELAQRSSSGSAAVMSAQESRAASVLQTESERDRESVFPSLEEAIVQACLLKELLPTAPFQQAVHSLFSLLLRHPLVAVNGPSYSGKTSCVEATVETLRLLGYAVHTRALSVGALGSDQLLGHFNKDGSWKEGILLKLLCQTTFLQGPNSLLLIVLDGSLSPLHLTTLLPLAMGEYVLRMPNMGAVTVNKRVHLILMSNTGSCDGCLIPTTSLSPATLSWEMLTHSSLLSLPSPLQEDVLSLMKKHIPPLLLLFSPLLTSNQQQQEEEPFGLLPQGKAYSETQLVGAFCRVLKCVLDTATQQEHSLQAATSTTTTTTVSTSSSSRVLHHHLLYSIVWSYGAVLNARNKRTLVKWLRERFKGLLDVTDDSQVSLWEHSMTNTQSSVDTTNTQIAGSDGVFWPYVHTSRTGALAQLIRMLMTRGVPVVLDGPTGSGKTSFLLNTLRSYSGNGGGTERGWVHLYMDRGTTAVGLWSQVKERIKWHSGSNYTPADCQQLVCLIEDLHLTQVMSKQPSSGVCDLLHHHISTGVVCDPLSGREHHVSGVSYLLSTDTEQAPLPHDLMGSCVVIKWEQFSDSDLVDIFSFITKRHFIQEDSAAPSIRKTNKRSSDGSSDLISSDVVESLVCSAVRVHSQLCDLFLATTGRTHYTYTMTTISTVLKQLCLSLPAGSSQLDLLAEWLRLSQWMYAGAMSSVVDRERYRECVVSTLRKYFSDSKLLPLLLREDAVVLPAHQVSSLQEKLTAVIKNHNATNPTLFIHLYPSSVKLVARITHLLSLPHDISSALLVGVQGAEKMAHLVAVSSGCTLVRPSQLHCSTYPTDGRKKLSSAPKKQLYFNPKDFETAMKNIYTMAGVKNERLLLFIDSTELQYKSNTDCVYRLIKDCAITSEFTMEERSKVVNAVRSDVCNSGVAFNQHSAWEFFLQRVKHNLRCVISLRQPSTSPAHTLTSSSFSSISIISEPWRELVTVTNTYYQLHWERKHLVEVASQHLKKSTALSEGQKERTAHLLSSVHLTLRDVPLSSTLAPPDVITFSNSAFEYFVELFAHLLEEREKETEEQRQQLLVCLGRVEAEEERVKCLEEKLKREKVVMEEKGNVYSQLLVQVGQDNAIAKEQKKLVDKQEERIKHLQKVLPEYDHLYMLYVEELDRIVQKTNNIAATLDTYGLTELRSLSKPPAEIQELMEAVIIITKSTTADLSWTKGAKRLMANLDRFKELLLDFTEEEVDTNSLLEVLAGYTSRSSFTEDNLAVAAVSAVSGLSFSVSSACGEAAAQLCKWVKGVESYHRLQQENVSRLHLRLRHVNSSLHEYTDKLLQLQHKLQVIIDRLDGLNESLEQASVDCGQQSKLVSTMDRELQHANKFLQALTVPRVQWSRQLSVLDSAVFNQLGVLTLAAAYTSYLTAIPPTTTLSIVNNHLLPCIADKGFTADVKTKLTTGLFSPPTLSSFSSPLDNTSRKSSDSTAPPPPPPPTATPHLPLGPLDADHPIVDSTEELAQCMLAVLSSDEMKSNQVFSSRNVYCLLHLAVISRAWNKWSLVYDFEETAVEHIKQDWEQQFADNEMEKQQVEIVDARDSSPVFLYTIEQCLVNGVHLLLTHFPFPLNPALLPVLALGQFRHRIGQSSPSIQFCGRRLHVHPSFTLTLTTSSLPSTVEEWGKLASYTQLVIFSPTFTLGRELLFHSASFSVFDSKTYLELCSKIKDGRERLKEVEKAVTCCLQKSLEQQEGSWAASEIEKLIADKDEVIQVNNSLQDQFKSLSGLHNAVQPLISFAAAAFVFLQELFSELCPTQCPQWHKHQRQVESVLQGRVESLRKSIEEKFEKETVGGESEHAVSSYEKEGEEFKRELIDCILANLARSIDHRYLPLTFVCLYLLSRADLTQATSLCTQQLLYLAEDACTTPLSTSKTTQSTSNQLPPVPDYVPTDIISRLYSAPLDDANRLECVRESMFTTRENWERFLSGGSDAALPLEIKNEGDLDGLVILKALSPEKWGSFLGKEVTSFISKLCSGLPLMVDVLEKRQENADSKSSEAILLMYDDCNLLSQYNTMHLESTLREHFKDAKKGLLVVQMSAGTEENADEMLTIAASTKCVLVTDVHLAPPSWFLTIPPKIQHATDNGTTLLLTQSPHHSIPNDFHLHPVYKLSQLAPTTAVAQKLPLICPSSFSPVHREQILSRISLLLLLTPASFLENLQSIPRSLHYLVPSLCIIHALLTFSAYLPNFSNLLFCFEYLVSLAKDEHLSAVEKKDDCIKHTLMVLASQIYPALQEDTIDHICSYSGEDSVLQVSKELSIPLPDHSVSLHQYSDYFIGILSPSSSSDKLRLGPAWDAVTRLLARTLSNVSIVKE